VRLAARLRTRHDDERGAVVVLVAAMTVLLFGVAALVADLGQARVVRREAQAASDSSALAAANALYLAGVPTPNIAGAVQAAKQYAADNFGVTTADWTSCQDPNALPHQPGGTQCISFDDAVKPSKVRVVAPIRSVNLVFGSVFGADDVGISAQAEASLKVDAISDCALCVVGSGPHDLQNGDVKIAGGNVAINGDVSLKSNGEVKVEGQTNDDGTIVAGTISISGTATGTAYTPAPLTQQQPIGDPLAAIPLPTNLSSISPKSNSNPCGPGATHGPGVYGDVTVSDPCVLEPGLYVVTGKWELTGNQDLSGTGVTLYFPCGTQGSPRPCSGPSEEGGRLVAHGNGLINLTAPTSGPYAGLLVAYDRLNSSPLWLTGNGTSRYVGTIYGYSAKMRYDGNGCTNTNESLIVVGALEFNGNNSCLQSTYTKSVNVYVPPDGLHLSR
jgi:hypothetical protein